MIIKPKAKMLSMYTKGIKEYVTWKDTDYSRNYFTTIYHLIPKITTVTMIHPNFKNLEIKGRKHREMIEELGYELANPDWYATYFEDNNGKT